MQTNSPEVTRAGGVKLYKAYGTIASVQDFTNTTTKVALTSVNVTDRTFTLKDNLALQKGDVISVDTGDFSGLYLVKNYDTSSKKVTVDDTNTNIRAGQANATYSSNEPQVYKVAFIPVTSVFKTLNTPDASFESIDVTTFNDATPQYVGGQKQYSDIQGEAFFSPDSTLFTTLKGYFNQQVNFGLLVRNEAAKLVNLYVVNLSQLGGLKLEANTIQSVSFTFKTLSEMEVKLA